jgi:hypothetical protein
VLTGGKWLRYDRAHGAVFFSCKLFRQHKGYLSVVVCPITHRWPITLHCQNTGRSKAMKQQNILFTLLQKSTAVLPSPVLRQCAAVRHNVMQTVTLQTQSFLFENSEEKFRGIPFYELSIEEWVVYENGQPKYLIDFNRRTKPLILDFTAKLNSGEPLEATIQKLGVFLGRQWTTEHDIQGKEIPNSNLAETITLIYLDNLADLFMDLTFIATNEIDFHTLLNEEKLFDTFLSDDTNGFSGLESAFVDNFENLKAMLTFSFNVEIELKELASNDDKQIFDLTAYKDNCISLDEFENNYPEWIKISGRQNTMDEYGNLVSIIGYVNRNIDKKHLLLLTEKRTHWS